MKTIQVGLTVLLAIAIMVCFLGCKETKGNNLLETTKENNAIMPEQGEDCVIEMETDDIHASNEENSVCLETTEEETQMAEVEMEAPHSGGETEQTEVPEQNKNGNEESNTQETENDGLRTPWG